MKPIVILEHDQSNPPDRLIDWLNAADVPHRTLRLHAGDQVPTDLAEYSGMIMLGGSQSAYSDKKFPWRAATLGMIQDAIAQDLPTLGICLSSQLIAQAAGGIAGVGEHGLEVGHQLVGRRDASYKDRLFDSLPMTPDAMQFHGDAVNELPPGAVLLLGGPVYPNQGFRVANSMWGLQFHIETTPETYVAWFEAYRARLQETGYDVDRAIERAVAMHAEMAETWAPFIARFAEIARSRQDAEDSP